MRKSERLDSGAAHTTMSTELKSVNVQYFALLREERGTASETLQTKAENPRELFEELKSKHSFSLSPERMAVAINDQFQNWEQPLRENDKVVFIPPVAGG